MSDSEGYSLEQAQDLIIDVLIPEAQNFRFQISEWRNFGIATHYSSALELGYAVLKLIHLGLGFHSYGLARGMLMASVEVRLLASTEARPLDLEYSLESSTLRQLRSAEGGNIFLSETAKLPNLQELKMEKEAAVSELFQKGAREIPDQQKLKRLGDDDTYDALYRDWSHHIHGGTGALIARHARFEVGDPKFELVAFDHGNEDQFMAMTTTVYELLEGLSGVVREYCSRPN